jgi:ABC-type uncharacterized transport system permease subunit
MLDLLQRKARSLQRTVMIRPILSAALAGLLAIVQYPGKLFEVVGAAFGTAYGQGLAEKQL